METSSYRRAHVGPGHENLRSSWRRIARPGWGLLLATALLLIGTPVIASTSTAYAAGPTISSFSPTSGPVGTTVTITGSGFTGTTRVLFGVVKATSFTVNSDTSITTTVPVGAKGATIGVHTPAGNVTSKNFFKVTPSVANLAPTAGQSGTSVTITGSAFTGATSVSFGDLPASFTVDSYGQISAQVPAGATTGPVTVTTKWGSGTSSSSFAIAPTFNVLDYGANGNDSSCTPTSTAPSCDNTTAFAAAIAAAQNAGAGSIVFVPAGTYTFSTGDPPSIHIVGTVPIVFEGAGQGSTTLRELTRRRDLLSVHCNGVTVENMTLDTQTFDGGHGLGVGGSYTLAQDLTVLGGDLTMAIYYPGPPGSHPGTTTTYSEYNVVNNLTLNDHYQGDGWSFSFQDHGSISNVNHTGSRITIYADTNTTITNYTYTPAVFGATAGFIVSTPNVNLTINHFVTSGQGGQIKTAPNQARVPQNITINDEVMTGGPSFRLLIGDVQGLLVENSTLDNITIDPRFEADGQVQSTTWTGITSRPQGGTIDITGLPNNGNG
jgi:hypothetical protein